MREWTTTEIEVLRHFAALGPEGVSQLLERSKRSVESKARDLGVSLKSTGQDFDVRLTPARLLRYVSRSPQLSICPMCGVRLAMMSETGFCRVCHLDRLIELGKEQILIRARERHLARIRQDRKRARVCESCSDVFFPKVESSAAVCRKCSGDG